MIANVENTYDVGQTKIEQVVNKPHIYPPSKPIYAPLDGNVAKVALALDI